MHIEIKGRVESTLRDRDGNIIYHDEGPNSVVGMSNNILMDCILPMLGTLGAESAIPARVAGTNMDDDAFHNDPEYIGADPTGAFTEADCNINRISYIAVGDNVGTDSAGNNKILADQGTDVAQPGQQTSMVDSGFDPTTVGDQATGSKYARLVDSVTFPSANQIRFETVFGTTEGNLTNGIAEIGVWTAGNTNNIDANGFSSTSTPTATGGMRLFARRHLSNTITKTDDGTLTITYTLTFNAGQAV